MEKGAQDGSVYYSPTYVPAVGTGQVEVTISPQIPIVDAGVGQISAGNAAAYPRHDVVEIGDVINIKSSGDDVDPSSNSASDGDDQVVSLRLPGVQVIDERVGSIRPDTEFKAQLSAMLQNRGGSGKFYYITCVLGAVFHKFLNYNYFVTISETSLGFVHGTPKSSLRQPGGPRGWKGSSTSSSFSGGMIYYSSTVL
jgi:hypothetical protein